MLVVSDHGHAATRTHPFLAWHDPHAIVIASGPSVPPSATPLHASYFDVIPTLLALAERSVPASCRGRSLAGE